MKNPSKGILALIIIIALIGAYSNQITASATSSSPATWQFGQDTWTMNTISHSWGQHTRQQVTVTVVGTQSNQRHVGYGNGGYYGQYPYYNQNPYYNPYCPAGASYCSNPYCASGSPYCSQYGSNPYCPVYSSQNPYCGSYYDYSPNNCVNYACTASYPYQYATTSQQVTPQVIIQNITVTQSVTATPTPTTQVPMAASTVSNADQTTVYQDFTTIVLAVVLSTIVGFVIASKMAKSQARPSQPQTFTPQVTRTFTPQATDKKFCHKCGSGIFVDSVYCPVCGAKVI